MGVKELNHQEMSEVVGGMALEYRIFQDYGIVDNSGRSIYYTAYYQIKSENYMDDLYLNLLPNEIAAVGVTYNFQTRKITTTFVAINGNDTTRSRNLTRGDSIKSRIQDFNNEIRFRINRDKANIKYFR